VLRRDTHTKISSYIQKSHSHGGGPGQGAQGVRDNAALSLPHFRVIGDCEAQEQPQMTWAEERQQLVSWVATAGAILRWKGRWKGRTAFGMVGSLSLVQIMEARVALVEERQ